jgi:membrane fusion protein, copper/silver efflux system
MNEKNLSPVRGALRVGGVILAVVCLSIGVFVGTRWSAREGTATSAPSAAPKASGAEALWTCSMHPQVIQDHPGLCPICHMALTPLDAKSSAKGLAVDPTVVQSMGVRTVRVAQQSLSRVVRTVGTLVEREFDHRDVNLRVSGWVQTLFVNTDGMGVAEGTPLFELYSPELSVAIEELIAARKQRETSTEGARAMSETLFSTAHRRLELMGLAAAEVDRLAALDAAPPTVTFTSPMAGHMVEKAVYAGAAVKAGDRVMRIANNKTLWVDARVFERDFASIRPDAEVRVHVDAYPSETFRGRVLFVHPHLDMETRTALVRAELENTSMRLREGMYATVEIETPTVDDAIVVPRESVIDTGTRQVAFVALAAGRFELREVEIGARGDAGLVQILSGLAVGEEVVASGQYLLDSESRMREAVRKFLAPGEQALEPTQRSALEPTQRSALDPTQRSALDPTQRNARDSAPRGAHDAAQHEPRKILPHPEWSADVDAVFAAYLQLADALGAVETSDAALDVSKLAGAAQKLAERARGSEAEMMATNLVLTAQALAGVTLTEQRRLFKVTSEAAIELTTAMTPSRNVSPRLYVMRCTMAPGRWIQSTAEVHNPFYGTSMKECGELQRTIDTARSEPK